MAINHKELARQFAMEPDAAGRQLKEAFDAGELKSTEFDFGRLFEACYGSADYYRCKNKDILATELMESRHLRESPGAVSTANFANITGQIVYSAILEGYRSEDLVFSTLIPTVPSQFLDGEKIAGITEIGDEAQVRPEGFPYALAGVGEDWIFTPPMIDRGMIVPVTWEAVFADRTGRVLENCGKVGKWVGVNKEKRAIDCVVDENVTTHRYNWRGTIIASYGDNSGTHTWDNLAASNALVDWTDVDNAEQVFNGMVDPYTGEPIVMDMRHLVVTKQLEKTAMKIVSGNEIRTTNPGYATSGDPTQYQWMNPYANKMQVVSSRLLAARMATDTSWFAGDITAYASYMQAEPLNVVQAPANNKDEFERRIVAQYRANERGAYVVKQPRAIVKSTA